MRSVKIFIFLLFFILPLFLSETFSFSVDAQLHFGNKSLAEEDWAPVDNQVLTGIALTFSFGRFPLELALEYFTGSGSGQLLFLELASKTSELNIGLQKTLTLINRLDFFLRGGLSVITGELSCVDIFSVSDSAYGFWFRTGFTFSFTKRLGLGLAVGSSSGKITLFNTEGEAGGFSASLF
ncbi:MAG TPA: hypothetical protein ENN73_03535, partial [Firmicutes bacterium]|nr:hypothetical protein [Bacillota bacterium]